MPVSQILQASLASGVPSSVAKSALPTGSVLQVVQGATTSNKTISGGPTDTNLTATITPTSATSKILVLVMQEFYLNAIGGEDGGFILSLLRNGTSLYTGVGHSVYIYSTAGGQPELANNFSINYLDSPATTSALTYKTQATATAGSAPIFQWLGNQSTLTLMEIAA